MGRWIREFGTVTKSEDLGDTRRLGRKGTNLAQMSSIGLPVPPGFTLISEVCTAFYASGRQYPGDLAEQVDSAMANLEKVIGAGFGKVDNPLLVSVRSSVPVGMKHAMGTVLNLGLNDQTVQGLVERSGDPRFAYDSYRRFIQMFGNVVLGIDQDKFEEVLENFKRDADLNLDTELQAEHWQEVIAGYKKVVERVKSKPFSQDVREQLWAAIGTVFGSWMNPHDITFRRLHPILEGWGTAVIVQAMVFGNMGEDCGTGVAFTRNPSTGENAFYGEYVCNAQGEDVVAGIREPQDLTIAGKLANQSTLPAMEETMPEVFAQLNAVRETLEKLYRDMQDLEFTVQQGKLYMLQTRSGKRTAAAALKVAVEMANEGLISHDEAIKRIDPMALDQLLHSTIDPKAERDVVAKGLPASRGAASGKIVLHAGQAESMVQAGEKVILCLVEASPEDISGLHAAAGTLTTRGGMTSHAAVEARGIGRPCVSGAGDIRIDYKEGTLSVRGQIFKAGDVITIDGTRGWVLGGTVPLTPSVPPPEFMRLLCWIDQAVGECGANVRNLECAHVAATCGRRKIVLNAVDLLLAAPDSRVELVMAATTAASASFLAALSAKLSDRIVELALASGAEHVCIIIGGTIGGGSVPHGRGGLAIQPEVVFLQHTAAQDAAERLAGSATAPRIEIAVANAIHSSDLEIVRKWSVTRTRDRSPDPPPTINVMGVVDSPHAILECDRIFGNANGLLIDLGAVAQRLLQLPQEAVETYQDIGVLDVKDGGQSSALSLLARCWDRPPDCVVEHAGSVILTEAVSREDSVMLRALGISRAYLPAEQMPGAILARAQLAIL